VNTELFGTAAEVGDEVTLQFRGATADIAAEARQRMAEQHAKRLGTPPADSGTAGE
jgi:hypothetical protein